MIYKNEEFEAERIYSENIDEGMKNLIQNILQKASKNKKITEHLIRISKELDCLSRESDNI